MAFVVEASLEKTYNVSRFAGTGSTGNPNGDWGPAVDAHFQYPNAVWFDTVRNLYISDTSNGRIRVVSGNKIISTFAGWLLCFCCVV
jgi:sugar lactone lactonase YvrE